MKLEIKEKREKRRQDASIHNLMERLNDLYRGEMYRMGGNLAL